MPGNGWENAVGWENTCKINAWLLRNKKCNATHSEMIVCIDSNTDACL